MALPTNYTSESFARFVKGEILQHVAETMDWYVAPESLALPEPIGQVTLKSAANKDAFIIQLTEHWNSGSFPYPAGFEAGVSLKFAGDDQPYRVVNIFHSAANINYVAVRITPYLKTAKTVNQVAGFFNLNTVPLVTDITYSYILDATLLALGLTEVSQINSSNIFKFRMKARVEAWRAVLSNTVSMTTNETQEGTTYNRGQVYNAAFEQLTQAEAEYDNRFNSGSVGSSLPATASNTTIRGAW